MKLHELKPAAGSRKARTRVGRGIAAGKGKTAGRGTKGQRSRAGSSLPAWFEGGQTPLHVRVPKLRGFKPYGRVEYQVVNVGRIADYARAGRFGGDADASDPVTVNAEVLRAAGLISTSSGPLKILGGGDVDLKLFVAADAFTASARSKIESAGGFVQALAPERPRSEPPEAAAASPGPAPIDADGSDLQVGASAAEPAQVELPEAAQAEPEAQVDAAQGDAETGGAGSAGTSRRTRTRKSAE